MSPQDWLDLSAHNRRPPKRKVFGRESERRRDRWSRRLGAVEIVACYAISGMVAGVILLVAVRYAAAWWTL